MKSNKSTNINENIGPINDNLNADIISNLNKIGAGLGGKESIFDGIATSPITIPNIVVIIIPISIPPFFLFNFHYNYNLKVQ